MRHQLGFLISEAFRGLRADRFLSITSIMTIGICSAALAFLLFGLSLIFSLDAPRTGPGASVRVFVRPESEDSASLEGLRKKISRLGGFDSMLFVGKDDALMEFRHDFGEEMLQYLNYNPLPPSFILYPSEKPLSALRVRALRERMRLYPEVEETTGDALHLQWLDRWSFPLKSAGLLLLCLVSGALALIVNNAIKLNLYTRRTLVENMKYCGASQSFILTPFVLEGFLLGLTGGLPGVAILYFLSRMGNFLLPVSSPRIPLLGLSLALTGITAAVALFSTMRTVRSFLVTRPE